MNKSIELIRNSSVRHFFLPIRSKEFAKFIPMAFLMFTILLNQNIVRILKDSITVTLVGPEVISFTKLWGEGPMAVCFVVIYTRMCNLMTTEKAFRIVVSFFLIFFFLFAFVIFPNSDYIHPNPEVVASYIESFPHFKWFIVIWSKWTYILFYIMGELWPMIVFCLLFWQLANKITSIEEAPRFYSFFNLFGQSNLLISGSIIMYFQSQNHCLAFLFQNVEGTELLLKSLMSVVMVTGIILLSTHYYIEKCVMSQEKFFESSRRTEVLKLSTRQSIKMVLGSRYLGLICILMICYGMSMNLIEGLWMSKVRDQYKTAEAFMGYQGNVLFWVGVITLSCSLAGSSIIRYFGWFSGAIITPAVVIIAGGTFFFFVYAGDQIDWLVTALGFAAPLHFITFIGGLQNALGKGAKYSLFDATKEMAYIPLSSEMKAKGKAAVDIIGNKIGKSTASFMQFLIFSIFPGSHFNDLSVFLGVMFVSICLIWLYTVRNLGIEYEKLIK
ncbi:MAG: NTP/NDP exchange transporter [Alphaproteobacteria bacterium]|nr:NTP/NDP exchange transporter [Alphaproteobacteria bacterium]